MDRSIYFFFQAEDGIRDYKVTGVQTCALPIFGARALSPNLGERMMAGRLFDKSVTVRELMPQDLKIEIDQLSREQATTIAGYLAGVVGRAHARQMDGATRRSWKSELAHNRSKTLDAPSWLWVSMVELMASHEAAYLDHC